MRKAYALPIVLLVAACHGGPRMNSEHHGAAPEDAPLCKGAGAGGNGNNCTILVTITATGSSCTVQVDRSQDSVEFDRGASNKWILWQLDAKPSGYRFSSDGIAFKSDPSGNFKNGQSVANGQVFRWKNSNGPGNAGSYNYTVNVQNRDGSIRCQQDPLIRNL
jgi:hypothetical protein